MNNYKSQWSWLRSAAALIILLTIGFSLISGEVKNGGFEEDPVYVLKDKYAYFIDRGWDLGDGPMAIQIAGWGYNGAIGPGKIRIIEGAAGKEVHSGKRCLMVDGKNCHITSNSIKGMPGKKYHFSLYARGAGNLQVCIYYSGLRPDGREGFLSTAIISDANVSEEWKKYEGTINALNPAAKSFAFALAVKGEVYIDDVVFCEEANEKE